MSRRGFTILEATLALGLLAIALVMVAQLATQALAERIGTEERLAAMETAANTLEAARALSWTELTPEWAAKQRLPEPLAERLFEHRFSVRVEPQPDRPNVKRVSVELRWKHHAAEDARTVSLVGLFADRSAEGEP